MHVPPTQEQAESYGRVAVEITGRMLEKQPSLVQRYLLGPILEPLSVFTQSGSSMIEQTSGSVRPSAEADDEIFDELSLQHCLKDLEKLISAHSVSPTLTTAVTEGAFTDGLAGGPKVSHTITSHASSLPTLLLHKKKPHRTQGHADFNHGHLLSGVPQHQTCRHTQGTDFTQHPRSLLCHVLLSRLRAWSFRRCCNQQTISTKVLSYETSTCAHRPPC